MKKYFQINNGFRNRVVRLYHMPVFKIGLGLIIATLVYVVFGSPIGALGSGSLAFAPLLKFDKTGLDGDNLKLIADLEKRMKVEPDSNAKTEIMNLIKDAKEGAEKMALRFKDIDDDKINLLKELLGTDDKGVRSILVKQGEVIKKLSDRISEGPEDLSIRSQVKKWQETNKEAIAKIRSGQKMDLPALEIRAASPMTPANSLGGSAYIPRPEFESGATDIVRAALTFWDYISKGRTSSAVYVWVNKKNPLGAAGWIGPGVAKPGVSLELASETSNAKKCAASEKVAIELLDDVEGFASYIEQELRYQVDKVTNTKLMSGVASATVPAGIQTLSVAYTLAGVSTDNPNNWDVIRAAVAQLHAGNLQGAVTVFVNPIDKANMDLTKAISQGQVFVPSPPNATIVEDNNIPVGYFQAAILQYYNVKIYKDYTVTYGWENDDFTKNLITVIGERRIHQYVKENYTGFAIYDTFANVKAAIAAA